MTQLFVYIDGRDYTLKVVYGADNKVHAHNMPKYHTITTLTIFATYSTFLLMMGMNNATSLYSCIWCTVSKEEKIHTYLQSA